MRGRGWLVLGIILGVAAAAGRLPYLAGAGRSWADTALRLVGTGASDLIHAVAQAGAPRRVVLGLTGVVGALVPGSTALLLVLAARGSLRLRWAAGIVVVAIGAASYVYRPSGEATGVLLLTLAVAAVAVLATGPLVATPLAALAALIGATFLPALVRSRQVGIHRSVDDLHVAVYNHPGTPAVLQVLVLVVAAVPFALALRLALWR